MRLVTLGLLAACHQGSAVSPDASPDGPHPCLSAAPSTDPPPTFCAHPRFLGPLTITSGTHDDFAAADLNGDGNVDLALDAGNGNLGVLFGHGDGRFGTPATYPVADTRKIAIGDLDGNGLPDIATLEQFNVSVLLNTGNGTYGPAALFPAGLVSQSLAIGDTDNDGFSDLIVGVAGDYQGRSNSIVVLRNDRKGAFSSQRTYVTGTVADGPGLVEVAVGDLNGDGRLDIVASGTSSEISVLFGRPSGFTAPVLYNLASPPTELVVADVNADGQLDIVAAAPMPSPPSGEVLVLLNAGGGSLEQPVIYSTSANPTDVALADFDEDGAPDLITASSHGAGMLRNQGDGTFAPEAVYAIGAPVRIAIVELDGDGHADMLANDHGGIGTFTGDGAGGILMPESVEPSNRVDLADFNQDGRKDLLGDYGLKLRNASGTFDAPLPAPAHAGVGDFDGDGVLDLITVNRGTNGQVDTWRGAGDGTFAASASFPMSVHSAAVGRINGTCGDSVVVGQYGPQSGSTTVLVNQGNGVFETSDATAWFPKGSLIGVALADANNDGYDDLFVTGERPGIDLSLATGSGDFSTPKPTGGAWLSGIADLNNDGNIDLVSPASWAGWGQVLIGNGAGGFTSVFQSMSGIWTSVGDVDGDGNLDLLEGRAIWYGHGDGTFSPPEGNVWLRGAPYTVVDADGDGLNDIITGGGFLLRQRCMP